MRISKPPGERRAELIAAARRLFDKNGVDKTRVSDIVKEVGVAQGVFYYYFRSKEEMVEVVARQVGQELDAKAAALLEDAAQPYSRKLAGFIELYLDLIDTFLGDEETSLAPLHPAGGGQGLGPVLATRLTGHLERLVEMGAAQGQVTVQFPWQTAQVLLHGLRCLAEEALPGRRLIYTLVEQGLGLPPGELMRWCPNEDKPAAGTGKKARRPQANKKLQANKKPQASRFHNNSS